MTISAAYTPLIELRGVTHEYLTAAGPFTALRDVSVAAARGEFLAVVGESGSGKSTLLALLAGIDRPTRGEVVIAGTKIHALAERELSAWRGRAVGIVFQFFQLLPTLTAAENVMLPMDFCGTYAADERRTRAESLLARLGVREQCDKLPSTLSGGQQQRVAVARALANAPALILADEPTGNLDEKTADIVLAEFLRLVRGEGAAALVATHNERLAAKMDRVVRLHEGRLEA